VADLLSIVDLPSGFEYPHEFIRIVELGLTNLEPWWILEGEALRDRFRGLRERYPDNLVVPFATRQDNDDVACWDVTQGKIVIVHDYAAPGWERRRRPEFATFYDWFRQAVEDCIIFDQVGG
jgi:hypothetical protein